MAMEAGSVIVRLVADYKSAEAGLAKMDAGIRSVGKTAEATNAKLTKFYDKASKAIIGAGIGIAAVSLKMATDFQTGLTQLVTGAGEAEKNIEEVKKGILDMAGVVGKTPMELVKGMYLIESAGFHGAEGLKVLKAAAEGAAVGGTDMETVANALTTALHDYNIPASQANAVTSALITTVAQGKTHLDTLANSLGKVLPTAAALKIPFEQVTAGLAVMTNAGMSARLASMNLNQTILSLVAPGGTAAKALDAIGLSSQKVKDMLSNPKQGLSYALNQIEDHLVREGGIPKGSANYVAALKAMLGGTVGFRTALMLTGANSATFEKNVNKIGDAFRKTRPDVKGWALAQKDLSVQFDKFKASIATVAIKIGDWLMPKAATALKWAGSLIAFFQRHPLVTRIASDAAIGTFVAAVIYKLGKGLKSAFDFVKGLFQGTAMSANTIATNANTAALQANTIAHGGTAADLAPFLAASRFAGLGGAALAALVPVSVVAATAAIVNPQKIASAAGLAALTSRFGVKGAKQIQQYIEKQGLSGTATIDRFGNIEAGRTFYGRAGGSATALFNQRFQQGLTQFEKKHHLLVTVK